MLLKKNEIQNHEISKRTNIILLIILLMFFILILNYFSIQILSYGENKNKSERNTLRTIKIQQERGLVYDRNDNLIAENGIRFSIAVLPEKINNYRGGRNQRETIIKDLLKYINQEAKLNIDIEKKTSIIMSTPSFKKTKIYSSSDYNDVAIRLNRITHVSGIVIDTEIVRNYPYGELFFHALGYTSKSRPNEINNKTIDRSSLVGRIGLERFYNDRLQGVLGEKKIKIGASGRVVEEKVTKRPKSGKDLKITLDKNIQKLIKEEFNEKKGVAVVLDVNNGDIIGYYSAPSVDPNLFSKELNENEMNNIYNDPNSPMLDRVINSTYSPASTIKPFIAFGALIGNFIDPYEEIFSAATYRVGNQNFREWQSWGHGDIDMARSLSRSSNYYYYDLGYNMGVDYMHDVLSIFNFGKNTPIYEINNIRNGVNPSNNWKVKNYGERFYKGEEVMISIGGGLISVSPMELVYATKLIANNGKKYQLKMDYNREPKLIKDLNFKEEWIKPVKQGLYDTVNTVDGTGRVIKQHTNIKVAGKTGTAQVFSSRGLGDYEPEDIDESLRNHSLFMGYAPYDNPKIAFIVIGENQGGGSGFASILSGKIVEEYLGEKIALEDENAE